MFDFSIVIPTYNRPERLGKCLHSLSNLDYPLDHFEVIVVDDGSPQSLDSIIDKYQQKLNINYHKQSNSGPATARNKGASLAKYPYLVFTDDDCEVDPQWLKGFASAFEKNPSGVLGGYTMNKLTNNIYSQTSQNLVDYLYGYYNDHDRKHKFFTSNNLAIPREIFQKIEGFDTTFPLAAAEDRELCDRIADEGYDLIFERSAVIYHQHFLTLQSFWKQHFNYGKGAKHFHQLKAVKNQEPIKLESLVFYYDLLVYPFKLSCSFLEKIQGVILLFISQLANTIGFIQG